MFRKMRRFNQQISDSECLDILKNTKRGVLSLIGDDGYPYGLPIDHWYCEKDGKIYFHGAKEGHKIDSIIRCDKASYCVYDEGYRKSFDIVATEQLDNILCLRTVHFANCHLFLTTSCFKGYG